jgi:hypothetical protein
MTEDIYAARAEKLQVVLRILGITLVLAGLVFTFGFIMMTGGDTVEVVAEEIMMEVGPIEAVSGVLLLLIIISGIVSALRIPRGWLAPMVTGPLLIVMALLMEPGTLKVTRWAFYCMIGTSLICWAAAIVHYFYDLYT